ncbi:MAG: sugar transferase [Thermodesulfovibrionales bacterium]|nr:sugar transferase [Thermodesulfovibrionales bacterium]
MHNYKRHLETFILIVIDLLSILSIFTIAFFIRKFILPIFYPYPLPLIDTMNFYHFLWIIPLWFISLYYHGLYTKCFPYWEEVISLLKAIFIANILTFTVLFIGKISEEVSRALFLISAIIAIPLFPLMRLNLQKYLRKYDLFIRHALIVGSGSLAHLILQALKREPHYGFKVIGFVDDKNAGNVIEGLKIYNGIKNIINYIDRTDISDIFIAVPEIDKHKIEDLIKNLHLKVNRILIVPDIQNLPLFTTELQHFFQEQILFLEIRSNLNRPHNILFKRIFDITVSFFLLVIFFIPMIVIAIAIFFSMKCNPIFTQERIGKNGKPFKMYKFRTMYKNADNILQDILLKDDNLKKEWELHWKLKNDPRVTKIGNILRKTSLDELPQLINILKGQMSLVGPRPYLKDEINGFAEEMPIVWTVLPGITGLWQVSGRSNTDNKFRVALDVWYVRNWSFWLDVIIVLKTVKVVLKGEGAY